MDNQPHLEQLLQEYSVRLSASLEMLTGEDVVASLLALSHPDREGEASFDLETMPWVWHRYPLKGHADCAIYTGVTPASINAVGTKVLLAAGLEEIAASDVQASYTEVQQGAVSALAQWLGHLSGSDLSLSTPEDMQESDPPPWRHYVSIQIGKETIDPLCLGLTDPLLRFIEQAGNLPATRDAVFNATTIASPKSSEDKAQSAGAGEGVASLQTPAVSGRSMERILDFELPLRISFGKAKLPLKALLQLSTGSIVELNRTINDPVDIVVNNRVIGRGEVVVVGGNYGVRIQEIVSNSN